MKLNWYIFASFCLQINLIQTRSCFLSCRFFEYIYLYQSMVMFQIEQKTKDCSKVALTEDWDPFDIPANSTFEEQYFIGGPGDNVEVQEWSDRKPARQRETGFILNAKLEAEQNKSWFILNMSSCALKCVRCCFYFVINKRHIQCLNSIPHYKRRIF